MMKFFKIILVQLILLTPLTSTAQIPFLEKYSKKPDVTYVYLSKTMLSMAAKYDSGVPGNLNLNEMIDKLTSLQILTYKNKKRNANIRDEVIEATENAGYPLLAKTDLEGSGSIIYFKEKKSKKEKASIILIQDTKLLEYSVILGIEGDFTEDDLSKLIQ